VAAVSAAAEVTLGAPSAVPVAPAPFEGAVPLGKSVGFAGEAVDVPIIAIAPPVGGKSLDTEVAVGFDEAPAESVDDAVGVAVGAAESEAETVVAPMTTMGPSVAAGEAALVTAVSVPVAVAEAEAESVEKVAEAGSVEMVAEAESVDEAESADDDELVTVAGGRSVVETAGVITGGD